MSGLALGLVLLGALCHATWNLLSKRVGGGLVWVSLQCAVSLLALTPWALWTLARTPDPMAALTGPALGAVAVSAVVHVLYLLTLQQAYQRGEFAVVYPVARGSGPLISVLVAVVWMGERPSLTGWAGVVALLLGIVACAGGWRALSGGAHASQARRAGVLWGGATGVWIASYTVIDAWAMQSLGADPVLFQTLSLALRCLVLLPWSWRQRAAVHSLWTAHTRTVVTVGVLAPLAYVLVLTALQHAPLSYVAPVREVSMLLAAVAGAWWLREPLSPGRVLGAACMLAGVGLLAAA